MGISSFKKDTKTPYNIRNVVYDFTLYSNTRVLCDEQTKKKKKKLLFPTLNIQ